MKKIYLYLFSSLIVQNISFAQNTYLPISSKEYELVDRLEAFGGIVSQGFNTAMKPYARIDVNNISYEYLDYFNYDINAKPNEIDQFMAKRAINISGEWAKPNHMYDDGTQRRHKPILKYFFETEPHFILGSDENYFVSINPIAYLQSGIENNHSDLRYIAMRGVEARAKLWNRIGIYTALAETQEKMPTYMTERGLTWNAYPGMDFFSGGPEKKPFDGFMTRAYIDFPIYKKNITATFGYDKHFIGDGIRSVLLSNSGAPNTFLRLRYSFGRFTYQNLYLELINDFSSGMGNSSLPKKYASIHYLGLNISNNFNIGFFESTIFNNSNKINPKTLIPIIYVNAIPNIINKTQESTIGLSFKYVPYYNWQLYGQIAAQDFEEKLANWKFGSWKNRWATQLGLKYFNIFTVKNMDLQLEYNAVRPFMYTSNNGISQYTHYNQPLAHPMENGFQEFIGNIHYQINPKFDINIRSIYSLKNHVDSGLTNVGVGLSKNHETREKDYGYHLNTEMPDKSLFFNVNGSYEVFSNFFIDAGISQMTRIKNSFQNNSFMFYAGFRWNMQRNFYDFN